MIAQAPVFLAAAPERFPMSGLISELQQLLLPIPDIACLKHHECGVTTDKQIVGLSRKALAETQIIYCIEQVALAHAVVAKETVCLVAEAYMGLGYVLEIVYV